MEPSRDQAKATARDQEDKDPELAVAQSDAARLRVDLEKEANRHREAVAAGERGWFGQALGGRQSAPLAIAFIAVVAGFASWVWCLFQGQVQGNDPAFWGSQADRALAFASLALGYVFGRGYSS